MHTSKNRTIEIRRSQEPRVNELWNERNMVYLWLVVGKVAGVGWPQKTAAAQSAKSDNQFIANFPYCFKQQE